MQSVGDAIRVYLQPAFVICVLVLAAAGMLIRGPSIPPPRPLKKSLESLDKNGLAPYKVVEELKIDNPEIIKELGTKDYIQWILEDTEVANGPVKKYMLFITYYERPDRVPHVPEECYAGGGYQKWKTESVAFEINKDAFVRRIPGKYLVFGATKANLWAKSDKFLVLYFFRVNEEYASGRNEARITLNKNLFFGKPSYFCKVELVFNQTPVAPSKEEAVKAGEKLLAMILPILEEEHWPDGQKQ